MKCPINLIFKETESFGFELVSILLIKYCSGSKIIRLPLKKEHNLHGQDLKTYSSENYEWSQWDCDFFYAKGFYNFFRTNLFDFFAMFFYLYTRKYKTGLLLSYFSIFYWGFVSNRGHWLELFGDNGTGLVLYLFSATAIAMMGVISIFQEHHWNTFVKS